MRRLSTVLRPLKFFQLKYLGARRSVCFFRLYRREHLTEEDVISAFPDYIGVSAMRAFLAPLYSAAKEDAGHLDLPTRVLYERFPECPVCLNFRASWLFHFGEVEDAREILGTGRGIVEKHDYLMQLYVTVLRHERRHDEARKLIQEFFKTYSGDLWRTPDFRNLQTKAVRRGVPPILIVTLPKSGSVFLLNTLSRGLSIPHTYLCPLGLYNDCIIEERLRDFAEGGSLCVDHILANTENLDALHRQGVRKIIFHYRDLRQSTLSFVHHSVSDEIVQEPKKNVLDRGRRFKMDQRSFEASYRTFFTRWFGRLQEWADCIENDDRFDFLVTNFDDLENEFALIGRILNFSDVPDGVFDWSILSSDRKERAGHFRKGLKDEWREVLSSELQTEIDATLRQTPVLARLEECRKRFSG